MINYYIHIIAVVLFGVILIIIEHTKVMIYRLVENHVLVIKYCKHFKYNHLQDHVNVITIY